LAGAVGAAPPGNVRGGAAPVVVPTAAPPPNEPLLVVAFGMPGAFVLPGPDPTPKAFELGLPVPADPLPAGFPAFGDPPPTAPAGGPPPT
jgi:hypothetical protein